MGLGNSGGGGGGDGGGMFPLGTLVVLKSSEASGVVHK